MEAPEEEDFPPPYVPLAEEPLAPLGQAAQLRARGISAAVPAPREVGLPPPPEPSRPAAQPTVRVPELPQAGAAPTAPPHSPTSGLLDSDASSQATLPLSPDSPRRSERARKAPERFTSDDPGTFTHPVGQFPLRQVPGANGLVYIHTPFNTADLFNWKQGLPPYRESPQQYVDLVTRIMSTHRPDIPDLFSLLSALLNEEERRQVMAKTYEAFTEWRREYIQSQPRGDGAAASPQPPTAEELLCLNPPTAANDPNSEFGRSMIEGARKAVREGLKKGVPRIVNYQKVYNTVQNLDESPAEFLTRLKDAYRRHTDVDPEEAGNLAAIRTTFIAQAAPDIRKKLQKLPTPAAQPLETLVQTAFQVYYQRPDVEEIKTDQKIRKKASLLAAALQPYWQKPPDEDPRRDRPPPRPLNGDQDRDRGRCRSCGSSFHWARDCPHRGDHRRRDSYTPEPHFRPAPQWERRGPLQPYHPSTPGQPHRTEPNRGNHYQPQAQGDRYPCEVRATPTAVPRTVMALEEVSQED